MWFFSKKLKVGILTPFIDQYNSPLYPKIPHPPSKKWMYFDMCLSKLTDVKYFPLEKVDKLSGFDYVFIHENLFDISPDRLIDRLKALKERNGKIYWVELHEKSLYSEGVFLPGFFDFVDLIFKHQLLEFDWLKQQLAQPLPNLAPYHLFGACDLLTYYRKWCGFTFSESLIQKHLNFSFDAVKEKILPLMYPFSFQLIQGGFPSYSFGIDKQKHISYFGKPANLAHVHRNLLAAMLEKTGVSFSYESKEYLSTLRESRFFLALGHLHSSLKTFDTLAFDTVLVHYASKPYRLWSEFQEYETFLPFGSPTELFPAGGLGYQREAILETLEQFQKDCQNEVLRRELLEKQKDLFYRFIDPQYILKKLAIDRI